MGIGRGRYYGSTMNRVMHFEIQAENPERAMAFYKGVFGWGFEKWGDHDYWMIMTAPKESAEPGINGGLMPRPCKTPPEGCGTNGYVCTAVIADFEATAAKIMASGGKLAMPKFAIPGMAWQGYFLDTEGNTFGIHEPDPQAK